LSLPPQVHRGITGRITDKATGEGIQDAAISVAGIDHYVHSVEEGHYWRILSPGTYDVTVIIDGYAPQTIAGVVVPSGADWTVKATVADFALVSNAAEVPDGVAVLSYENRQELLAYDPPPPPPHPPPHPLHSLTPSHFPSLPPTP